MAALTPDLQAKIEAYLLGRLGRGEQTKIEALLFEDDDVFEAIRDAEDDLIDRYVAGELPPADRDAFEHAFAVSTSRQERIALARALSHAIASGAPASGVPTPPAAVESPPPHPRRSSRVRRLVPAGAALAAALVIAIAWRTLNPGPMPSGSATGDAGSGSGETVRAGSEGVSIATFSLGRVELRRGSGSLPRLALPRGTTDVRLQPALEAPVPASYAVTLRRIEGPLVWQETARVDGSDHFSVTVPARLLGTGDYVLGLATPGAPPEDRAEFPFRIIVSD